MLHLAAMRCSVLKTQCAPCGYTQKNKPATWGIPFTHPTTGQTGSLLNSGWAIPPHHVSLEAFATGLLKLICIYVNEVGIFDAVCWDYPMMYFLKITAQILTCSDTSGPQGLCHIQHRVLGPWQFPNNTTPWWWNRSGIGCACTYTLNHALGNTNHGQPSLPPRLHFLLFMIYPKLGISIPVQ